jgi:diguanylate cyclase (GGDEF)-like protein
MYKNRSPLRWLAGTFTLSNWPFALKMAFCPILATILLASLSLHGIFAVDEQADLIRTTVRHDLATAVRLSKSAIALQEINNQLYRLTTLQASKIRNLDVSNDVAALVAKSSSLSDDLDAQSRDLPANGDQAEMQQVASEIRVYRDAIDVFGSMLDIDFASAVELFQPFDRNARNVIGRMDSISDRAIRDASRRGELSNAIADRIRLVLLASSAAGFLLMFGTAGLLTRATVGSVKRIAAVTEKVAGGDATLDIAVLSRGDELGIIVSSLEVFQANVSKIAFMAHHDSLTRLPNRVLFHDRIDQAAARLDRGIGFAVLCLDLDRFKVVNDTLGHPVGDGLLRHVADRLQACVREGDSVGRLGGDEFAILLLNVNDPAELDLLAARIIEVIGSDYEIDGHQITIGTSIGLALAPIDGSSPMELMKKADTALYQAKANGRGTFCFYEDKMNAALQLRRQTEVGLRRAIALDEFKLFYQPLVEARSRRICSFEALIRWQHPERGMIQPDNFIPVAESSGLIGAIGQWVLRHACLDASTWPDNVKIAVNLSPSQFKDKNLVANVRAALAASGLSPDRLELEIVESVLLHDGDAILTTLRELKAMGVKISMDDFGTGYSSLSYLRSFPFDKVKIDRSFIKDLPHDASSMAIVRAIVGLGETFGMSVTAEGVETEEQAAQLALAKCDHLQGYLFSKAIPAEDVNGFIKALM